MSDKDVFTNPDLQSGYDPKDEPPLRDEKRIPPLPEEPTAEDNRGHRAAVTESGEAIGSGAAAGGKGGPEDFDSDPQAGDGAFLVRHDDDKPDTGGDASQHNST